MNLAERARLESEHFSLLTGSDAGNMLRLALASRGKVYAWRVHRIHHRPGAGVTVGYCVSLQSSPHANSSRVREKEIEDLYILASTAKISAHKLNASSSITLTIGDTHVHLWEYPNDPELPALALASDAQSLEKLLGASVNIEMISYRPTRRAVFHIEQTDSKADETNNSSKNSEKHEESKQPIALKKDDEARLDLYAKVIRPSAHADLIQRLKLLEDSGIPSIRIYEPQRNYGQQADLRAAHSPSSAFPLPAGLVFTHAAQGVPLSRFYAAINPKDLSNADLMLDQLEEILDALPQAAALLPKKPAWADRCEHYAHAAGVAYPAGAARAKNIARQIRYLFRCADFGKIMAVHGDFYEANVLINPSSQRISALLDVDSLGPGYRAHDWGCLLGHLAVLPSLSPTRYRWAETLCARWFDQLSERVDPVALCASTAGVVLSLVAGGAKQRKGSGNSDSSNLAEQRLLVAEEWVNAGITIANDPCFNAHIIELAR